MKDYLQQFLSRQLKCLVCVISERPTIFIIVPFIVSALLSSGFSRVEYEDDVENLIRYDSGRAMENKRLINKLFPRNTSDYVDIERLVDISLGPILYAINKNGGSVWHENCMEELEKLNRIVRSIKLKRNGMELGYEELCGKVNGHCHEDQFAKLLQDRDSIFSERIKVPYFLNINQYTFKYRFYFANLGGVTTDKSGFVEDAEAFRIFYLTDSSNASKVPLIKEWTNFVIDRIKSMEFNNITVLPFSFSLLSDEFKNFRNSLTPVIAAVVAVVGSFSFITSMTSSWITSKPWLGVSAVISAGLAIVSSFGLMFFFGVPTTSFNIGIPFVILGTEVDDAYVLIGTWRKTNSKESVRKRMGDTFAETGVSITITSLTNVLSCCIGLVSDLPGVKFFCLHCAVALAFTYIYMITFFAACMAIDGFREENRMNAITFKKCLNEGKNETDTNLSSEVNTMKVFKDVIGKSLEKTPVKTAVILIFVANLSVGAWGLLRVEDGLDLRNTVTPNSLATESLKLFYRYFTRYYSPLHIALYQPLNYSDPLVQESIEGMLKKFQSHPKVSNDSTEYHSWLKYYTMFQKLPVARISLSGYNLSVEEDFIDGLRNVFLRFKQTTAFRYDIQFNKDYTKILASRFIIPIKNIRSKNDEHQLLIDLWKIADESKLPVIIHSPPFPLIEQGVIIRGTVFQITWITSLLIFFIFLAFIPNLLTTVIVSLSVLVILVESVGYAALWGMKIDAISISSVIICVGFSVNYPSHVAYAFTKAKDKSPDGKMKECLYHVGLSVFQGSLSSILSSSLLTVVDMYACMTFSRLILIISLQTAFQALFVLPVALSFVDSLKKPCQSVLPSRNNSPKKRESL